MLNSLTLGTDGAMLRGTRKKALVLGVAGMLFFSGGVQARTNDSGDGFTKQEIAEANDIARRKRILADDEDVFLLIQTFMKTQ
jgi:hypothetical protein